MKRKNFPKLFNSISYLKLSWLLFIRMTSFFRKSPEAETSSVLSLEATSSTFKRTNGSFLFHKT